MGFSEAPQTDGVVKPHRIVPPNRRMRYDAGGLGTRLGSAKSDGMVVHLLVVSPIGRGRRLRFGVCNTVDPHRLTVA